MIERRPGANVRASAVLMDTLVTVEIADPAPPSECERAARRALDWFVHVEECCTRFEPDSELMRLCRRPGEAVQLSEVLYRAIEFAVAMADASRGAFDPAVGQSLERLGFNESYRTGLRIESAGDTGDLLPTYHDIALNQTARTVTLARPMVIDLGAVAKGLAMDLAGLELRCFQGFAIDAGGDVLVRGTNASLSAWTVGIQHPRDSAALIDVLSLTQGAVCTSGDYERTTADGAGHHILTPASGKPVGGVASVTVVAGTAILADALSTAAFVLGPAEGVRLIESAGAEGLIVSPALARYETVGWKDYRP